MFAAGDDDDEDDDDDDDDDEGEAEDEDDEGDYLERIIDDLLGGSGKISYKLQNMALTHTELNTKMRPQNGCSNLIII